MWQSNRTGLIKISNICVTKFGVYLNFRCCDPTELGSYVDAVKCQKCKEGYMLPERALDLEA